jgi:hypothetical protein
LETKKRVYTLCMPFLLWLVPWLRSLRMFLICFRDTCSNGTFKNGDDNINLEFSSLHIILENLDLL